MPETNDIGAVLRALPAVSEFLNSESGAALCREFGAGATKLELRQLLDDAREEIRAGRQTAAPDVQSLSALLRVRLLRLSRPEGRRAINATGILLHTGLGRAPLCAEALAALAGCSGFSVLQASLDTGDRSLREEKVQRLLIELTGCEAATVVNNNAAATMLILNTLAAGKEAIVSRGQLIEIGGAFRIPDVMAMSSATLREVGTTNRTHLRDYEKAINEKTGALVHVHTSNYRIRGFTGTPELAELAALAHQRALPLVDDQGSGALVPLSMYGLPDEPLVRNSIAAGSDIVCFSGDKLICGPQAGIICGKGELIARIRKNPFSRMFRVCKLTLAALEATLVHFVNGDAYKQALPLYRMLGRPLPELETDARKLADLLKGLPDTAVSIAEDLSYVGSGSAPDEGLATRVVRVQHGKVAAEEIALRLRTGIPAVFARIKDGQVLCDLRTLLPGEVDLLAAAIRRVL